MFARKCTTTCIGFFCVLLQLLKFFHGALGLNVFVGLDVCGVHSVCSVYEVFGSVVFSGA